MPDQQKINKLLSSFSATSLDEMDSVRLMIRRDQKYLFPLHKLPGVLEDVKDKYKILEIDGIRNQLYTTTYFDTKDLDLYMMHHRGKMNRHKIRLRKYNTHGSSFLEIKRKTNLGFTNKSRVPVDTEEGIVLNQEETFLKSLTTFNGDELVKSLNNEFHRITLVDFKSGERVTLDYGIKLKKSGEDWWINLDGICIAEIKRTGNFFRSSLAKSLKRNKIYPMRFSKYCYGVANLYKNIPYNRFKEKFMKVDKLNAQYT